LEQQCAVFVEKKQQSGYKRRHFQVSCRKQTIGR
jgi:hypothetical protein